VFLNGVIGYFDARATTFKLLIKVSGSYYLIYSTDLKSSIYSNFAYANNDTFDVDDLSNFKISELPAKYYNNFNSIEIQFNISLLINPYTVPTISNTVKDQNNVQISDVSNPYVFDAQNYQQVSEGSILAFGTNTDPISDSQFGQFPLYVFTSLGLWALEIGAGDIFITKVVPVNGEVLLDRDSKVDMSIGTIYASLEGLKLISGMNVIEISETAEGLPDQHFSDNTDLQYFLNLPQTVELQTIIDHVSFKTYLDGAKIGYSKGNDSSEIYVINSAYQYAWMFDVNRKLWSKVTGNYTGFINNYPELYAVRETVGNTGIVNMSKEITSDVPCYFHTKGLSMSGSNTFKKLHRSFLRGFFNMASGKYAAFYLFGSDDLINWTFITGNDRNSGEFENIWMTHSANSKKYYNYVFAGDISFDATKDSHIKYIEFQQKQKWSRKLR
jgi:hypothetical protein